MTFGGPQFEVAARTDTGLKRRVNEDALLANDPCFIVADGMGGHDFGDRASRAAVAAFSEVFTRPGAATLEEIDRAFERARFAVREIAAASERGAGCTLTGVIRIEYQNQPCWYVFNIGDSRVYLKREAEFLQLTQDHSLREELFAATAREAEFAPRNVITRALGSTQDLHDAWLLPIETGSRLLVCSDGLTNEISFEDLRAVLAVGTRAQATADELMRRALEAGGRDNVTLIVIDVLAGGATELPVSPDTAAEGGGFADDTLERTQPRPR